MGRRADHTREELYEAALAAAWKIGAKEGLRGLTARRIADAIVARCNQSYRSPRL